MDAARTPAVATRFMWVSSAIVRCNSAVLSRTFVAGFANFFLSPAPFMNQVRAAKGYRCMIRSHCEQHPVSFGWEVAALTADGYQTSVRVEPNRNNNAAKRFQSVIKVNDIWNDLLTQRLIKSGELELQPVQKFSGGASPRDVDRGPSDGIEQ